MNLRGNLFIFMLSSTFLFLSQQISAQEWVWKWGAPGDQTIVDSQGIDFMGHDRLNRFCSIYTYNDTIHVGDTVFGHSNLNPYISNAAIAFYKNDGQFDHAIDIYSNATGNIWHPLAKSDNAGNIYIACEFQVRAFLLDSIINHGPAPYPETPDIFIAKLGPDLAIQWIRLIWGTSQSTLDGFEIGADQQLLIATSHYANGGATQKVHYFGADSSSFTSSIQSLLKVTPSGTLAWRREYKCQNQSASSRKLVIGADEKIYHINQTSGAYYIGQDTIPIPSGYPAFTNFPCLLVFDNAGNFNRGLMVDNGLWSLTDLIVDPSGELYFAAIYDTAFIGNDTLTCGADSTGSMLGKADPNFSVSWYHAFKTKVTTYYPDFHLALDGEDLYFASTFTKTFQFAGQTFQFGSVKKPLIGRLLPGGILDQYTTGKTNIEMDVTNLRTDNCGNLVVSGYFKGIAYLGKDTLHGYFSSEYMGYIQLHPPLDPGLGNDTAVCGNFVLHATPGYPYYVWNHGSAGTNTTEVTQTGWYSVLVRNDNYCWASDSVYIAVTNPVGSILESEATIYKKDSLLLSITLPYEHCIWSTGDTTRSILVHGNELGVGKHDIGVTINFGACASSDTIHITVVPNPGIGETNEKSGGIYPNPASENVFFPISAGENKVGIYSPGGKNVMSVYMQAKKAGYGKISLQGLPAGCYFLRVVSDVFVRTYKFVKI